MTFSHNIREKNTKTLQCLERDPLGARQEDKLSAECREN